MSDKQSESIISEIIDMAWCDKTSFDDILTITGVPEHEVINIMRLNLKPNSFKLWRKRVTGRKAKHSVKYQTSDSQNNDSQNDSHNADSGDNEA
jgi:uncharacterized protein (TIGR03643 family)